VIYLWVRATVDWGDEEAVWAQLRWQIRPNVELWNKTLSMPFHRYRQRVREIAALNQSRVEGAEIAQWDQIPDGAAVLPVDDDDWFAPDVARAVDRDLAPGAVACLWPSRWIEVPHDLGHRLYLARRRLLPWTKPKYVAATNNYAMVKSPETREWLEDHTRASRWFEARLANEGAAVRRIDRELSLANRNLGSQTSLGWTRPEGRTLRRSELTRKLERYRRLYRRPLPAGLAWSRPYVAMMAELMDALEVAEPR
jgi:PAS domain-containing protein